MVVNLGSGVDLQAATVCQVCDEAFEKRLPGSNVCGACQVAMAIVMHHNAVLYRRWGVIYLGVRR